MASPKLKISSAVVLVILLAGGFPASVFSGDAGPDNLSPAEIFKRAQDKYASLSSYRDEGNIVATLNGMNITTTFTIRLARPDLYRIEWKQSYSGPPKGQAMAVWSAGNGDFLNIGMGAQKQTSREIAIASATGISGGAAADIPGTFFKMNWGNQLGGLGTNQRWQNDEKTDGVDCYVLTSDFGVQTRTLWIGKQDFLIHQIRTITSPEVIKAALANAAKTNPGMTVPNQNFGGMTSTETHANIILNQKFSPADFSR